MLPSGGSAPGRTSASRRSSRRPRQSCSAYQPPVQSSAARTVSSARSRSASGTRATRSPAVTCSVSPTVSGTVSVNHWVTGIAAGSSVPRSTEPVTRRSAPAAPVSRKVPSTAVQSAAAPRPSAPAWSSDRRLRSVARGRCRLPHTWTTRTAPDVTARATCTTSVVLSPSAGHGPATPAECSRPVATVRPTSTPSDTAGVGARRPAGRRRARRTTTAFHGTSSSRPSPNAPCAAATTRAGAGVPTP